MKAAPHETGRLWPQPCPDVGDQGGIRSHEYPAVEPYHRAVGPDGAPLIRHLQPVRSLPLGVSGAALRMVAPLTRRRGAARGQPGRIFAASTAASGRGDLPADDSRQLNSRVRGLAPLPLSKRHICWAWMPTYGVCLRPTILRSHNHREAVTGSKDLKFRPSSAVTPAYCRHGVNIGALRSQRANPSPPQS